MNQNQQNSRKCITVHKKQDDYAFYMREIEKNIIYQHQKYKLYHKSKSYSLTKNIPLIYKSTKQTSIQFEQINRDKKHVNSVTQQIKSVNNNNVQNNNGNFIYYYVKQCRNQQKTNKMKQQKHQYAKELDKKMKLFVQKIGQFKLLKKQALLLQNNNSDKKVNPLYKKYIGYGNMNSMSMIYGGFGNNIFSNGKQLRQIQNCVQSLQYQQLSTHKNPKKLQSH